MDKFYKWMESNGYADTYYTVSKDGDVTEHLLSKQMLIGYMREYLIENGRDVGFVAQSMQNDYEWHVTQINELEAK